MEDLLKDAPETTAILANPEIVKLLDNKKLLEYPEEISKSERVARLFADREKIAQKLVEVLPSLPNLHDYDLMSLLREIEECLLFGLNGAAITLCGILVEYSLKKAIYFFKNNKQFTPYNDELYEETENITLHPAIDQARKLNIISEELKKDLIKFKEEIRNPYNHYNLKKITKGVCIPNQTHVNLTKKTYEVKDIYVRRFNSEVRQIQV